MISIDNVELNKFNKTATEWWDKNGEFKMLHKINPTRINYINNKIRNHFNLNNEDSPNLENITILDVGCGGGIVSIPLAELKANVTGLDANENNIHAASEYCSNTSLIQKLDFVNSTVEEHVKSNRQYDVVLALEVIEHVASPGVFIRNLSKLVKPGGMIIISTLNRTLKSYIFAIIMAEYLLRWVPIKTHNFNKFLKPSEISAMLDGTKLSLKELKGLTLDIAQNKWTISMDVDVNYFAYIG